MRLGASDRPTPPLLGSESGEALAKRIKLGGRDRCFLPGHSREQQFEALTKVIGLRRKRRLARRCAFARSAAFAGRRGTFKVVTSLRVICPSRATIDFT